MARTVACANSRRPDAIGVVNDAVEDGVGERGNPDQVMPAVHGNLAGDDERAFVVAILDDFEQIARLVGREGFGSPIIEDEQFDARQRAQKPGKPSPRPRVELSGDPLLRRSQFPSGTVGVGASVAFDRNLTHWSQLGPVGAFSTSFASCGSTQRGKSMNRIWEDRKVRATREWEGRAGVD
jgi:hypothetical protein